MCIRFGFGAHSGEKCVLRLLCPENTQSLKSHAPQVRMSFFTKTFMSDIFIWHIFEDSNFLYTSLHLKPDDYVL